MDKLDLKVAQGELCVLLGPNGAGKSTTVKMLAGLIEPAIGTVTIHGVKPCNAKARLGVLPENLGLIDDLTVEEHLWLSAGVYNVPSPEERIEQLLQLLGLSRGRATFARECSHGMRKKTAFAMAVLHNPRVLILDEPFEAIDPVSTRMMMDALTQAAARGTTVFLTSHVLAVVEEIGHRFLLFRNGRIVLDERREMMSRPLAELYFELVEAPVTERLEWLGCDPS
ncbi:ABC transporter ATP-binding protein [Bryobacterales bacterium F-183]|nr:ABC transporter ATP-binding protein [Bryobacterales bacterium F-183]